MSVTKKRMIRTAAPGIGDLVPGHRVVAFWAGLSAVSGTVVEAGRRDVVVDFGDLGRILLGIRRRRFTWRRSAGSYQDATDRTRQGAGLAIVKEAVR